METNFIFLLIFAIANGVVCYILNNSFSNQKIKNAICYSVLFLTEVLELIAVLVGTGGYNMLIGIMVVCFFFLTSYSLLRYVTRKKDWREGILGLVIFDMITVFIIVISPLAK